MRLKPLIVLVIFFQIFSLYLTVTTSDTYGSGKTPKPDNFCTTQVLKDITLTKDNLIYRGDTVFDSSNKLTQILLAKSGTNYAQNYVYVKAANDWQNGFVTTFNMLVDNPTCYKFDDSTCLIRLGFCWWRSSTTIESRCGADGFAVILRYSQIDGPGLIGSGLGYGGIYNALAIEFDTFTNTENNDPDWDGERHISVIIRQGQNNADEKDRIAWNYRPVNFKSDRFEGFLRNPSYRIEYLNRNLRVFINGILQLEYYDQLDAQSILGMPTALSYLGITASTGGLTNDNLLTNWVVKKVLPTSSSFQVLLDSSNPTLITAGQKILIDIFMFDSCGNRYVPFFESGVDSENFLSMLNFSNTCSLMSVNKGLNYKYFDSGPAFQAIVSCLSTGPKKIQMTYNSESIGNGINVVIYAGSLWAAEVFQNTTTGSVDTPYSFIVRPYDQGKNLAQTTVDALRKQINVVWPNPPDSRIDYSIVSLANGDYNYTIDCQFSGNYAIISQLFIFNGFRYDYSISTGQPDMNKSIAKVLDANYKELSGQTFISAGTKALLSVRFYDKNGNNARYNETLYKSFLSVLGVSKQLGSGLPDSVNNLYNTNFQFTQKGANQLLATYLNNNINCPYCQFQVTAGASQFQNADLLIPDSSATIKFSINPSGNNYVITKPQTMSYLLVLKDVYGNLLDSINSAGYTATLSGNNMKAFNLSLSTYSIGCQVSVPDVSLTYFQTLVGRSGYMINVTEISSKSSKTFNLTIVSDGSDNDADNGDFNPLLTSYYWIVSPVNGMYVVAGSKYKLAIQLNTLSGKRYNQWIAESDVVFTISPIYKNEVIYNAIKGPKPGLYTVEFTLTYGSVAGTNRMGGITVTKIKSARNPNFKSIASDPAILSIDSKNLKTGSSVSLNDGIVLSTYQFLCHLTDLYGNAVNVADASKLNLLVQNSQWSYMPACAGLTLGDYSCRFIPQAYGNYVVNSSFFTQAYNLSVSHGVPSIINSNASIINDLTNKLFAGVNIMFRITPKDASGSALIYDETISDLQNFSLSLKTPDGSLTPISFGASNVISGDIITTTLVTKIGQYSFLPLLNGQSIMCEICAFEINFEDIDSSQTKVFLLVNQDRKEITPSQTLQIDNSKIIPLFYMQFYDKYLNQRPVSLDFKAFNAVLTVPESGSKSQSYSFIGYELRGDYQFLLPSSSYNTFEFELSNPNCSLLFSASNTKNSSNSININFPTVILLGTSNDSAYTNDVPDPKNVVISPNSLSFIAGDYVTLNIELRATNGKLYRDLANLGWYSDANLSNAFTLSLGGSNIASPAITKGKQYGTYSISFTSKTANYVVQNLQVSFLNPEQVYPASYVLITQTVPTLVSPGSFVYLQSQDSSSIQTADCKATTNKLLTFYAFDKYDNIIRSINTVSLGFKLKSSNPIDMINPTISVNYNGLISLSMLCRKVGTVTLTSLSFKDINGLAVSNYQFQITPGDPDAGKSLAYLMKQSINAGSLISWYIIPSDIFENVIKVNASNNPAYALSLFNATDNYNVNSSYLGGDPNISTDGNILYWTVNLTVAGTHLFKAFYNNLPISSTNNQVQVLALAPFFTNTILAKYNSKTATYDEYSNSLFSQDISENPRFKVNYYDLYQNAVNPPAWSLQLYLFGQDVTYDRRMEFCSDANVLYAFCASNSADQSSLDKNPQTRYSVLIPNLAYQVNLLNKDVSSQSQLYNIQITGLNGDNSTKNLPIDPANTIITPKTPLQTVAGESTQFTIELRTTSPNYRRNEWFADPMASLALKFAYNSSTISYNITQGDITDRYFVTIRGYEAHPAENPNVITVIIQNTSFFGYQPRWIVTPAAISSVKPASFLNSVISILSNIPQGQSIDSLYSTYFQANDRFNNIVNLLDGSLNIVVNATNSGSVIFTKDFLSNGLLRISFQPQKSDTYYIYFVSTLENFSTQISQGSIDITNSYATLMVNNQEINSSIVAGSIVQVMVYPFDKFGNSIVLDANVLKEANINYYYKKPGFQGDIVGESPSKVNSGLVSLEFDCNVTIKGSYIYKVSIQNQEIRMVLGLVNVHPAKAYLAQSILKYLDDTANQYVQMDKILAIKEDNTKEIPSYNLILADVYGNLYDEFDANPTDFNVILTGNQITSNPLNYVSNQIVGNALYITLANSSLYGYRVGLFNTIPYSLQITWNRDPAEVVNYPIILLGQGADNDNNAEINTPENLTLTWVSKTSLSMIAGGVDTYLLEIRTNSGKRKADFNKTISFNFFYMNGSALVKGNFSAVSQIATLRGRYLVTVYGELANNRDLPFVLKMSVENNQIPVTLNVTVNPNKLSYVKLASDLVSGTANDDYVFNILPYDQYSNIADVTENDINLKIVFPVSNTNASVISSYSSSKDPASGSIMYLVKSRVSGIYQIQSNLLTGNLSPQFIINPGVASSLTSKAIVTPNSGTIRAGDNLTIDIIAMDAYYNQILAGVKDSDDKSLLGEFTLTLTQGVYQVPLTLKTDSSSNNLVASVLYTQAGLVSLGPQLTGNVIRCDGCSVTITPGDLDLKQTKFFAMNLGDSYNETRLVKVQYGARSLVFNAEIFDKFGNLMKGVNQNNGFTLTMDGNEMNLLTFNLTFDGLNYLAFAVKSDDSDTFSRLVPRDNYSLTLTYIDGNFKDFVNLALQIVGEDKDAGNGPYVPADVLMEPQSIHIAAGHTGVITITLRQKSLLRYNGVFDLNQFQVNENNITATAGVQLRPLNYRFSNGNKNGVFLLEITGTQAFNGTDKKNIYLTINSSIVHNPICEVIIVPDYPLANNTIITNPYLSFLPTNVSAGNRQDIVFQLFDQYGNLFARPELASQLYVKIVNDGNADFNATYLNDTSSSTTDYETGLVTTVQNNSYVISMYAKYPPRVLQVQVFYSADQYSNYPISSWPFTYIVHTFIATDKTDLVGADMNGVSIGQDFNASILVKDTEGYCFEDPQNVKFTVTGPYISSDINNNTLTLLNVVLFNQTYVATPKTISDDTNSSMNSSGYICKRYYEAFISGNVIQKIGYYQFDILIDGQNNGNSVKTIRKTYMTPGSVNPMNSLITVPILYNRGSNPLQLMVNTAMSVMIILRDNYKNIINQNVSIDPSQYFDFRINGLIPTVDYDKNVTYVNTNATFIINLEVKKTGTLGVIFGSLMGTNFSVESLDKVDYPSQIDILAGPCSPKYPSVNYVNKAVAGVKQFLTVQCQDDFNNTVYTGGANFQIKITGQVEVVGLDIVNANIKDLNSGLYSMDYTFTWAGNYTVLIFLNYVQYTAAFPITVVNSLCSYDAPYYCLGGTKAGTCVTTYRDCGYSFIDACPNDDKPISCQVNGNTQCVADSYLCDCTNSDDVKCASDQKCVNMFSNNDYCALQADTSNCQGEFSTVCDNSQVCRTSASECPSYVGCPPGTKLCLDQTCVDSTKDCPSFSACDNGFKCEDQSCANDISDCPTRITCTNPGWIICPDKTCQPNELSCKLPNSCSTDNAGNQLFLCPDQSCRTSQSDCPKPVTCSLGFALCEDGSCRKECTVSLRTSRRRILYENRMGSKLFRLLADTTTTNVTNSSSTCPSITCPGGECTDNVYKCPSVEACPQGYVKCADLSCAVNQKQCLVKVCPVGKYHCWDGNCVDNSSECATRTTCPPNFPVKCPDGSCTDTLNDCDEVIECPPYSPYRCANGECRGQASECPTLITCPLTRPILCPDNTCQKNKDACNNAVVSMKCADNKIRCADGSCAYSKQLCPTVQSCNPGQIRCWDNTCALDLKSCPSLEIYNEICPLQSPLRCPDGSCRADVNDCPTQIICPIDRPVKCDDGTCKQSNSQCALNTECPTGVKRCPDGSCAKNQKCGTPITCSEQAPFLCYDNTCKIDPRDCPAMPTCSDIAPILCPDGTCVSQRINCNGFPACEDDKDNKDKSVRCPDLFCYSSRKNCSIFMGCPGSRVLCDDGSCAQTAFDCPSLKCPIQLPYACPDGFCVSDSKYCDNSTNGCPYNRPKKCADGLCVDSLDKCANNNVLKCPTTGDHPCSDGSCAKSVERCPNEMGCSAETPFMCGNGLCINPSKTSCQILHCPSDTPIKCLNGLCAKSITFCSSFIPLDDYSQCSGDTNGNNVPCADGRCVASADLCKPLLPCDSNSVRCKDNSCRPIQDLCPITNASCPINKPYRCDSGACAKSSLYCPTITGCPANYPWKCELSGTCVKNNKNCSDTYKLTYLMNNCTIDKPYLCSDGTCGLNSSNCTKLSSCPLATAPYKCIEGSCVSNKSLCPKASQCKQHLCPDFRCVSDSSECLTMNGCPANKPFKCVDGRCVSTPFSRYGNNNDSCVPMVACPKYKPYICGDGECQGHPSLCRTQQNCPDDQQVRCPDQRCVATYAQCQNSSSLCPQTSPFMCQDGTCVSQAIQCQTSNNLYCSDETPFRCASGNCVKYKANCVDDDVRTGKVVSRLLLDSNSTYNSSIDPGCTTTNPNRCYDGTCRSNVLDCPLSNGCMDVAAPYKCLSGICVARSQDCTATDANFTCYNNLTLCEDGYCRFNCPAYNGCPNTLPLLCPNGFCARSLSECAGDSACDLLTKPYRCVDNTCVYDRSQCSTPKRNYQSEIIQITVSPLGSTTIDFIQAGENSQIRFGQLIIPAGAVLPPVDNTTNSSVGNDSAQLYSFTILPIAESFVKSFNNPVDKTKKEYTNEIFPYTDGALEYHQSVRSSLVRISTLNRDAVPYRFPLVLYLSSDVLVNTSRTDDYCMGRLNVNTGNWECHSRALVQQDYDLNKMGYPVSEDGIFSVIFNPKPLEAVNVGEPCGFFCEYKMTLLYVLIGLMVFSVVATFAIWRISRYVTKYRATKQKRDNLKEQISDYEQAQTEIKGQSMKDKMEGISFTSNPAFKEQSSDVSERIAQLEKNLESSQKRNNLLDKANKELLERNTILNEEFESLKREVNDK